MVFIKNCPGLMAGLRVGVLWWHLEYSNQGRELFLFVGFYGLASGGRDFVAASPLAGLPCLKNGIVRDLPAQAAGQQSGLDFQQASVADSVFEQGMRDQ